MGRVSFTYIPKAPATGVVYQVVREHFETFRVEATRGHDRGLPRFIEDEFRGLVRCGVLAGGFARFRCTGCGFDRLVPFSCKARAVCPSCGGRRMVERAAHLVDHVFPVVPVNVHVHALVLDGVYVEDLHGGLRFHALPAPLDEEMDAVLLTVWRRLDRLLARRGLLGADDEGDDRWREEAPVLTGMAAASVQGRRALGERAGAAVARVDASGGAPVDGAPGLGPCHARWGGYDLHAAVVVPARDRARLERVCRYTLRPPVAHERLRFTPEGRIVLDLRHRWADGTTHLVFDPLEFLERLAALTPRPRINLVVYYGVLGARAAWRGRVVPSGVAASASPADASVPGAPASAPATSSPRRNCVWAELMQRTFGLDVLACPDCGGRLLLIALIEDPWVIRRILGHLGVPTEVPAARPARSPPLLRVGHDGDEVAAPRLAPAPDRSSGPRYDPDIDVP